MVDVNRGYHTHGHHRSLSSLASSIMPVTSDTSTSTSLTASPIDPNDPTDQSIELKPPKKPQAEEKETEIRNDGHQMHEEQPEVAAQEEEGLVSPEAPSQHDPTRREQSEIPKESPYSSDGVTWNTLVERAQEETFERRRLARLQQEVAKLKLSNGLDRRLQATSTIAYGNLIDQFKGDDQAGFTGLFEASERLSARCESSFKDEKAANPYTVPEAAELTHQAFQVAADDAESILSFLDRLRTDLDYLSNLIADLPSSELSTLTSCYHPAGVELSILANHSHGRTSAYSRDSQMMKLSRRMDNIDVFHNKDPYFAMLYTIFDPSALAGSREDILRKEVWARTCARVVTDGKEGSEEFIIATIDAFTSTDDWDLQTDIGSFVLEVLAEGWFILDPPIDEPDDTTGSNWEPERASHAIAVAEFFDRRAERFLNMLAKQGRNPIPTDCLDFIRLILSHVNDPQTRELAKKFIVSRWYFASFITSLLVYPEVRGLSLDHHIGHSARQKILHRLALHIQTQVFSVLAPSSALTYILPEVRDHVLSITEQFEPSAGNAILNAPQTSKPIQHLMMSPWDIIGLVDSLHPDDHEQHQGFPPEQFSAGASTTTLRPDANQVEMETPRYAESLSTDSTYVDDPNSQMSDQERNTKKPRPITPMSPLAKAISTLRSSALGLGRDRIGYSSKDWIHFEIDSEDSLLKLESAFTYQFTSTGESRYDYDQDLHGSSAGHQTSREAVISLLFVESDSAYAYRARPLDYQSLRSFSPLFEARIANAKSNHQFQAAHTWWRKLTDYKLLEQTDGPLAVYTSLSQTVGHMMESRIQELRERTKGLDDLSAELDLRRRSHHKHLQELSERRKSLRIKMWYASDVKNSGPYEDALRVTRALRAMANPKKPKQAGGFASWARQRLRGTTPYDRADKQALETMCASKDEGGLSKLGDEQIDITTRWNTKNNIVTFCQSEERIHRFFYEVQKLVQKLSTTSLMESPVLWSSHFFRQEKRSFDQFIPPPPSFTPSPVTPPLGSQAFSNAWSPQRHRTLAASDRLRGTTDFNGLQITSSPYATVGRGDGHRSLNQPYGYLSPPMTPLSPRPVEVFSASPNKLAKVPKAKQDFTDSLRKRLLGLVNSDLGYLLWATGSETDVWIKKAMTQLEGVSQEQNGQHQLHQQSSLLDASNDRLLVQFGFQDSYATMLNTMSLAQDPRKKLEMLASLQDLILSSYETSQTQDGSPLEYASNTVSSLAKITDQCTKRYTSSLRQPRSSTVHPKQLTFPPTELIETLQHIFSNSSLRPPTLFRDLQSIASLIPSSTLDHTSEGSAFWTASIAALSLKDTLIAQTISHAQAITEYHLSIRATHPPLLPPTDKDTLSHTTLKDAADLWLIGAKEGNPVAARELALFYLTHPELLKRTSAPMTKGKDVFVNTSTNGGAALDPKTFCVVLHWMQVAASGGDQQAIGFLRENNGKKA